MSEIYLALGGDLSVLGTARTNPLPNDLFHERSGTHVEVDEMQHFTSFRRLALDMYPRDMVLGFDRDEYRALCAQWAPRADRYRQTKDARGFGPGGRQRQRAYYDSIRDLAAAGTGLSPVLRVPAPEGVASIAYERARGRLVELER